jgi:hypothetical protein
MNGSVKVANTARTAASFLHQLEANLIAILVRSLPEESFT